MSLSWHGKKHGEEKRWYENGQLENEVCYANGERHGIEKWWNKNGNLEEEKFYLNGKEVAEEDYQCYLLTEQLAGLNDG